MNGLIDEVGIRSRGLTSTEVESYYNNTKDSFNNMLLGAEESAPSGNTAPTITANATSPSTVYANTDFKLNLTITDLDADTLTGYVQFYKNGISVGEEYSESPVTNNTNTLIGTLNSGNFSVGDTLIAEFWASDGINTTTKENTTEVTVIGQLISACTDLTTSDITYYLDSDILNTGTTKCMEVSANDVTLDCQGHIIDATGTVEYGIYITNSGLDRENFKLVNCIVTDFTKGLYAVYSKGINITDSIIANNTQWDVHIDPSAVTTRCDSYFSNVTGTNGKPIVYYNTTVTIEDWNNNVSSIILCNADDSVINNLTLDNDLTSNVVNFLGIPGISNCLAKTSASALITNAFLPFNIISSGLTLNASALTIFFSIGDNFFTRNFVCL